MDNHAGFSELQSTCQVPKHCISPNYPYLNPDPNTRRQPDLEVGRDSLGSDCSVPGMVEDHGSDVSLEDDYRFSGTELWDSFWQNQLRNRATRRPSYPALIDCPAKEMQDIHGEAPISALVLDAECRRNQSPLAFTSTPLVRQRPRTPKAPPKASYSIFPPPSCPQRQPSAPRCRSPVSRIRTGDNPPLQQRPKTAGGSTPVMDIASTRTASPLPSAMHNPRQWVPAATIRAVTPTPSSPPIPFPTCPGDPPQRPLPEVPNKSRAAAAALPPPPLPPLPPLPPPPPSRPQQHLQASRRPSLTNLRNLSLTKISTHSSPALARLARSQAPPSERLPQPRTRVSTDTHRRQHPLRESTLAPRCQSPRPLPPLPREEQPPLPPPPPPQVSVFDFDSDTESLGGGDGAFMSASRGLARRLMRELTSHGKDKGNHHHQRSASGGPSSVSASTPKGRRAGDDTTVGARGGKRGEGVGAADLPGVGRRSKEGGRPWSRRILGRWSA